MKIGFIGLGRMGYNMCLNLMEHKHKLVVNNLSPEPTRKLARKGAVGAYSLEEVVQKLPKQKILWLMVPAGKPVEAILKTLTPMLKRGDIVIDGGNSFYKDSIRRHNALMKKGIHYLDCGTSGGMSGARHGACMMIGGNKPVFKKVEKLFRDMCVKDGYGHVGKSGAGHFVKMVHNGIEYGMMGALSEGMQAIEKHNAQFGSDLKEVSKIYANGSIIAGKLSSWLWDSFRTPGYLNKISCTVPKGETEDEMKHLEKIAKMPVLHEAREMRVRSRTGKLCGNLIAAMRNQFGGHAVIKKGKR